MEITALHPVDAVVDGNAGLGRVVRSRSTIRIALLRTVLNPVKRACPEDPFQYDDLSVRVKTPDMISWTVETNLRGTENGGNLN